MTAASSAIGSLGACYSLTHPIHRQANLGASYNYLPHEGHIRLLQPLTTTQTSIGPGGGSRDFARAQWMHLCCQGGEVPWLARDAKVGWISRGPGDRGTGTLSGKYPLSRAVRSFLPLHAILPLLAFAALCGASTLSSQALVTPRLLTVVAAQW